MTESDRSLQGRIGANISWANTRDRTARTAPARAALEQKFLDQAGGDPVRAAHLRKAYFQRLALKSPRRDGRAATMLPERERHPGTNRAADISAAGTTSGDTSTILEVADIARHLRSLGLAEHVEHFRARVL